MREAELSTGERIGGDLFVSTIPTEVYLRLLPGDRTPRARADPLLRADLGGLRHPSAGGPARLLDQPGLARPDRLRHLSAELAEPDHRTAGRQLRQLRHPPARSRPAAVPRARRASCWRGTATISGRSSASSSSRSGPMSPGCRCIRRCSVAASGTRRSGAPRGRTCTSPGTTGPFRRSSRPAPRSARASTPAPRCSATSGARTDLPAQASELPARRDASCLNRSRVRRRR